MLAYITSIGEPTTLLCEWSLKRHGFDVEVVQGNDSFNNKLQYIYNQAQDDFLRVDADVIVNRNVDRLIKECPEEIWWWQSLSFDWWKQDIGYVGVQYIKKACIPYLRENIGKVQRIDRPESAMYRLPEFHNPRRCESSDIVCGLHGWGQNKNDIDRIKSLKISRGQIDDYDFELAEALNEF